MINNERGCAIVVAIMVLAILTLISTAGLQNSMTELKIATNCQIHEMEFYGAESALAYGPIWSEQNILPVDDTDTYDASVINLDPITLGNKVTFTTEISYVDIINRVEPISNMPDINVKGTGTHPRKGEAAVEQIFRYVPAFQDPGAPVRSTSELLTIQGSPNIDTNGADVPEVLYDMEAPDSIDPPAVHEVEFAKESICADGECNANRADPENYLQWDAMRANSLSLADVLMTPDESGHVDIGDAGTIDDPQTVFVDATTTPVKIQGNGVGYGVLFIDGDVDTISGTLEWYGVIIINGKVNNKINGNITIHGSLFLNNAIESEVLDDDEDDLYGNMSVIYDPDMLNLIKDDISGYKPTPTWRYVH